MLLTLQPDESDYGIKKTLTRIGFQSPNAEFVRELVDFWKLRFLAISF